MKYDIEWVYGLLGWICIFLIWFYWAELGAFVASIPARFDSLMN